MNRRNFFKKSAVFSAAFPIALSLFNANLAKAEQIKQTCGDVFEVFSKEEISQMWKYVPTPVFKENGQMYHVKTYRLKVASVGLPMTSQKSELRYLSKVEINCLELTHIHSVRFCESPYIDPQTFDEYYSVFVRGARVRS